MVILLITIGHFFMRLFCFVGERFLWCQGLHLLRLDLMLRQRMVLIDPAALGINTLTRVLMIVLSLHHYRKLLQNRDRLIRLNAINSYDPVAGNHVRR